MYGRVELEVCVVHVCTLLPFSEHVMLEHRVSLLCSFCAAEDVLKHFQDQFIKGVDANAIAFYLKAKNIIPDGVEVAIRQNLDSRQQNQVLYSHLERACDEEALITVCDIMISVQGYPKMNKLGKNMKSRLQGKCSVHAWF